MADRDEDLVSKVDIAGVAESIAKLQEFASAGIKSFTEFSEAAEKAASTISKAGSDIDNSLKPKGLDDSAAKFKRIEAAANSLGDAIVGVVGGLGKFATGITAAFAGGATAISGFILGVSKLTAAARGATITSNTLFREQRKLSMQMAQSETSAIQFVASLRKMQRDFKVGRDDYFAYSEAVYKLKQDYKDQVAVQEEVAEVQQRMVKEQEKMRAASAAYDAQLRLQIAFGKDAADSLINLGQATERVQFAFRDAFSPAFAKIFDAIDAQITKNIDSIERFANELGAAFSKFVDDNKDKLPGLFDALMQAMSSIAGIITGTVIPAFQMLNSVAGTAASVINTIFGTEITGNAVLAAAAVAKVTGAFNVMIPAIQGVIAIVRILALSFGGPAVAIAALGVAVGYFIVKTIQDFGGLQAIIQAVWDSIASSARALASHIVETWNRLLTDVGAVADAISQYVSDAWENVKEYAATAWQFVVDIVTQAGETITQIFDEVTAGIQAAFEAIAAPIKAVLQTIIDLAQTAINMVKQALGMSGGDGGGGEGFARGGHIRGRGTSTSDSIPIWASDGEYMVKARAVRHYGVGVLNAINNMRLPIDSLGRKMRGFKMGGLISTLSHTLPGAMMRDGGLVASASVSGHPVEIHLPDRVIKGLTGSSEAIDELQRFAVMSRVRSTGRKPSWKGA